MPWQVKSSPCSRSSSRLSALSLPSRRLLRHLPWVTCSSSGGSSSSLRFCFPMAWWWPSWVRRSIPRAACTTGFAWAWATVGAHAAPGATGSTFHCGWQVSPACSPVLSMRYGASNFRLGSELPSSLPLCGASRSWQCSRWPRPIGSWMAAPSSRCSLPPWWESSASGLPATTALPTICRLRPLSPIWETLTH